jgi:hypothetical protein
MNSQSTTPRRIRSILKTWNQSFPNRKFAGLTAKQFEEIFLSEQSSSSSAQAVAYFPAASFANRVRRAS